MIADDALDKEHVVLEGEDAAPASQHAPAQKRQETNLFVEQGVSSDWTGQFDAALRGRKVELHPRLTGTKVFKPSETFTMELFDGVRARARVTRSHSNVSGTITTSAKLEGSEWGHVFLTSTQGQVHARIHVPEKNNIYSIEFNPQTGEHHLLDLEPIKAVPPLVENLSEMVPPTVADAPSSRKAELELNGDGHTIAKEKEAHQAIIAAAPSHPSVVHGAPAPALVAAEGPFPAPANGRRFVGVMIVCTGDVMCTAGSKAAIDNLIAMRLAYANDAQSSSDTGITIRLVHSYELKHYETGNGSTGPNWVWKDPDVAAQREAHGADFVQMIVLNSNVGGIGWLLDGRQQRN